MRMQSAEVDEVAKLRRCVEPAPYRLDLVDSERGVGLGSEFPTFAAIIGTNYFSPAFENVIHNRDWSLHYTIF